MQSMEFLSAIITVYGIFRNSVNKLAWIPFAIHLLVSIIFPKFKPVQQGINRSIHRRNAISI